MLGNIKIIDVVKNKLIERYVFCSNYFSLIRYSDEKNTRVIVF